MNAKHSLLKALLAFILLVFNIVIAQDKTITITTETENMPNIRVVSSDGSNNNMRIYKMLVQDIKTIGHFNVFYDDTIKTDLLKYGISLSEYKEKNIHFLAQISHRKDGKKLIGILTLKDIAKNKEEVTEYEQDEEAAYPFIAHTMAAYLSDYIKAQNADWVKRYVIFSRQLDSARSQIVLADYTFTYQKPIISNGLNVFPKWADKEQNAFYYTSIKDEATIYKYDLYSGEIERIASSQGMAVVSDVSRDGSKLLMTMSPVGLSDVFLYDVKSKKLTQLTTYSGIDVNANFLNNDKSFAFVSDRLGYPNVFVQDLKPNGNAFQLVFRGRNNSTIAAFGDYVVFSSRETDIDNGLNGFNLYLVSSQSDYIRRLSRTGTNRIPRFSYDGDSIMYLRQVNGQSAVGVIRLSINKSFLFPLKNTKIQAFDW